MRKPISHLLALLALIFCAAAPALAQDKPVVQAQASSQAQSLLPVPSNMAAEYTNERLEKLIAVVSGFADG